MAFEQTESNPILRRRAEENLKSGAAATQQVQSLDEANLLLHELRVHQIELEMQNEELHRTQVELETARERYSDLYELAPVGYCTLSEQGLILEANLTVANLLGAARGDIVNKPLSRYIFREDQDVYYLHRKQLFGSGEPQVCDLRMLKMDMTVFWAHLAATAARGASTSSGEGADGAPVCRVVISDITERMRAEEDIRKLNAELELRIMEIEQANERLKEVDRLKSMFIASMSHELWTPLNSIIGFSTVLLNEWAGPANAEQKQNLASILRSGKRLLNMVNDILDVTRIEAGAITPVIEEFDLYDLLAEAENEVAAAIREKGLELRSELLRQRMRTDRQRLMQCVLNILSNAAKFTDEGVVTLEARIVSFPGETPEEEMVEIAVTDTGIGIGEEDQSRIFHPFYRIVTPQREIVPSTGLGLFLTRKIATEILSGDIQVSSEYGKGSRFSLRIPVRLP